MTGTGTYDKVAAIAALLLIGVVMVASYLPARKATQVSPVVALKYE